MRRFAILFCTLSALLLLASCGGKSGAKNTDPPAGGSTAAVQTEKPAGDAPEATPEPTPEPTPTPEPLYQFGTPVEECEPLADDSYFEDAAFVGDSRTEGLWLYSDLHTGDYLYKQSMSVFHVDESDYSVTLNGQSMTLMQALKAKQFGKVYIMLGLNELGYPASAYEEQLGKFLDDVIAAQPDAVIYLELMPPVNDALTKASWQNNENVNTFNDINTRMAEQKHIALLNVAEVYRDGSGQLKEELATSDGCHFQPDAYDLWADYLRSHVIDADWYFTSREAR